MALAFVFIDYSLIFQRAKFFSVLHRYHRVVGFLHQEKMHEVVQQPTLFSLRDSSDTGVAFTNTLTYDENLNPYIFRNFSTAGAWDWVM